MFWFRTEPNRVDQNNYFFNNIKYIFYINYYKIKIFYGEFSFVYYDIYNYNYLFNDYVH